MSTSEESFTARPRLFSMAVVFILLISAMAMTGIPIAFASRQPDAAPVSFNYQVLSGQHSITGVQRILIVLVDFQDVRHSKGADQIKAVAVDALNAYYQEVSYGKISIAGDVYGWYTVGHPLSYYGRDNKEPGDDHNLPSLASDAVALLPSTLDVMPFEFLVVVHAGMDQAADSPSTRSDEIWSQCYCAVFPNYRLSDAVYVHSKAFSNYAFLSEFNGVGTFAHEWGHLFGLPDLYDSVNEKHFVGYWSLMDYGNWCCYNDAQSTPSYIGAWGAALLGWLSPSIPDSNVNVSSFTLKPLESPNATAELIPVSSNAYYFVEYRTHTGRDSSLPKSGALVYFVDEWLGSDAGIVKLVNPKTGKLFSSEEYAVELVNAVFRTGDTLRDTGKQVYLKFLNNEGSNIAIYSKQELSGPVSTTTLRPSADSYSGMYSAPLQLTGILTDSDGRPLPAQTIDVDILDPTSNDWRSVGTGTTNEHGEFTAEMKLTYAVGDYRLRFRYAGEAIDGSGFVSSITESALVIKPAKMTLTLAAPTIASADALSVTAAVVGVGGEPLSGVLVTLYLDGVPVGTTKTDILGAVSLVPEGGLGIGSHTITVRATLQNYLEDTTTRSIFITPPFWIVPVALALVTILGAALWKTKRKKESSQIKPSLSATWKTSPPISDVTTSASKFCMFCGEPIQSNARFCPNMNCGRPQD